MLELDAAAIEDACGLADMIPAMRAALLATSAGDIWVPLRARWSFEPPKTTLLVMPASSATLGLNVVKTLAIVPENAARGRPSIQGDLLVSRRDTGSPVARLEAEALTLLRTAACSAAATDHLASPAARVLAIFGAGPQAVAHAKAMCCVRPISEIWLFGRNPGRAQTTARAIAAAQNVPVTATNDLRELARAEIICTATDATVPLFAADQVADQVHINAIGAFRPDMRELPADLLRKASIFVDHAGFCAAEAGDLIDAFGIEDQVRAHVTELGAALSRPHTRGAATIYKSVGNAGQDLFAAAAILERMGLIASTA